ncbi:hypothetical protein niasHS_016156 [Heterodera schachtii]|uniref:RING-type domain-containing protein n=2 Tax=Heterodera TaxID=34509 RepID=A0ABD2IG93_9BILA
MEVENSNNSPNIVGVKEWSMCRESIKDLLGPNFTTYFILNFYHKMPVPEFGLSALSAKQLFWHEIEEKVSARNSDHVLVHRWAGTTDADFWTELGCDMDTPVVLTLEAIEEDPKHIKIMFSCGSKHSAFIFKLCPIIEDAYLIFFVPYQKFRDGHLSLLSSLHFLEEYMGRMRSRTFVAEQNQCIICQKLTELVFQPCGHATYCKKCDRKSTKDPRCPICRLHVYDRYEYRLAPGSRCVVCPARFGCHRMDCMVLPCRCVVGCKQYTQLAVQPGRDPCPACNFEPVDQLVKVFVQQEQ